MKQTVEAIIEILLKVIEMLKGLIGDNPPVVIDPPPPKLPPAPVERELIWADEFMGNMDHRWRFMTGPHREAVNTRTHAYVIGDKLKMECFPRHAAAPRTSYLRTFDTQDLEALNRDEMNLLLDPSEGPLYIETSVNLSRAHGSQGAWWAFWLFAPNNIKDRATDELWDSRGPLVDPYDGRADTGMEIDIFEYAPHLPIGPDSSGRVNGLNCAVYIDQEGGAKHPQTPDGHGYFYDINNHIKDGGIDFTQDKFWKIGFRWTTNKYEFFIEDQKYWEVTDPRFITKRRANGIVMSWEVSNGLWGESGKTFQEIGKPLSVDVDYVRVYREK